MNVVLPADARPRLLAQARAVQRVLAGEPQDEVAADAGVSRRHLSIWTESISKEGLYQWLGKSEPKPERIQRARQGIVQILLGSLAESHFEALSRDVLGDEGFTIEDLRVGRSDTDYRLLDAHARPICRFNIKFHGTLFRESVEYVGLEPADCFALATYKINAGLRKQDEEHLAYVFLIISVPNVPREALERLIPAEYPWLASISGRATEEAIVRMLLLEPWVEEIKQSIAQSSFRVISARRAYRLLTEKLFERVHALRLRGFNRTFRGAEINMHLSLSSEMIGFADFLRLLAERGAVDLSVRLDRGEI